MTVSAPTFVDLSADEERRAVDALAELLVPLLFRTGPPGSDSAPTDAPIAVKRLGAGIDR